MHDGVSKIAKLISATQCNSLEIHRKNKKLHEIRSGMESTQVCKDELKRFINEKKKNICSHRESLKILYDVVDEMHRKKDKRIQIRRFT